MSKPKGVFNGKQWTPVVAQQGTETPIPPVADGDGSVFVSVASYRDGERCGDTLQALFENAKDPDKVIVGLIEQNDPEDQFCLEEYCSKYGIEDTLKKGKVRKDTVKVLELQPLSTCPRRQQIRHISFHHFAAKGPMTARSMGRKALGNEEFCMQIDSHTSFAKDWDVILKDEWKATKNEFGVISTVPPPKSEQSAYEPGGAKEKEVPRQCKVAFKDNGFPDYMSPPLGLAVDLEQPLMSHGWSAAFSFSKCHLEEAVPNDPFAPFAKPIEQFSRYARMWTRGYDTYTPTRNAVFHDFDIQPNGHGEDEWFKRQRTRLRMLAIKRVKTALQIKDGDKGETPQANLGLYGVGKRRSLDLLDDFANMDLRRGKGNTNPDIKCSGHEWVPYDKNISPIENMYDNPDNLDPQPEFPLRTNLVYYQQVEQASPALSLDLGETTERLAVASTLESSGGVGGTPGVHTIEGANGNLPSPTLMFTLWAFGLCVWCLMFMTPKASSARQRKKKQATYKDV